LLNVLKGYIAMKKKPGEEHCTCRDGVTRRDFFATMGAGALIATTAGGTFAEPQVQVMTPEDMSRITLLINGRRHRLLVEPRWSLLYVLRERLGLTGTKLGCDRGECGACTVLINDVARYSCLTLAVEAEGDKVITIEGLMNGDELGPMQQAFVEYDALQCGYCTPGQIIAAEGLLRRNPEPSPGEIQYGMSGNLCRCGSYRNIFHAVQHAADLKSGRGGSR
jgi:xanthine dehydrogenase YagT iron-sulfur-binding subunit